MDDQALLTLLQVLDSQFPVGHFAHSGGLETYAQLGLSPAGLSQLIASEIELGWGRLDLSAAAQGWAQADSPAELEMLGLELDAWKVVEVARQSSVGLGRRTLALASRLFPGAVDGLKISRPHHAIIVGALGRRANVPRRALVLAFGQSLLTASLAAAMRCMPLSPERAQELVVSHRKALVRAVDAVMDDPAGAFFASTPALDIRRHQQTMLTTRLFRS